MKFNTREILDILEIRLIPVGHFGDNQYEQGWQDAIKNVKYQIKKLKEEKEWKI